MKINYNENRVINNSFVNSYWEDAKHITDVINDKYGKNYVPDNLVVVKSCYSAESDIKLPEDHYGICIYLNGAPGIIIDGRVIETQANGNSNPFIFHEWEYVTEIYYLLIKYV